MRKREERQIGAHKYYVTQLGALQGREVLARLANVAAPILKDLAEGTGLEANAAGIAAFSSLAQTLKPGDLVYFCDVFSKFSDVTVEEGKMPRLVDVFDDHFAGNYMAMIQWLAFALEVNFGSFFGEGSLESVGAILKKA